MQAAAAIRDAAIREWVFLTADEKTSLISSPKGYVQAKVSSVAAQLMKRGWLDFMTAENEVFLYHVSVLSFKNASAMYYFFDIIACKLDLVQGSRIEAEIWANFWILRLLFVGFVSDLSRTSSLWAFVGQQRAQLI
ncbi:hypothetical protein TEA_017490 [Camellia sinensis var. sinensis]|uniref:Uncharacterized protein n=1 Tax=Camellia sinensis var. sinensis TaxID=542762 RepID=A0A4S4DDU1_CAMSN|nr:hypothetical protein TEA_017490 [Camellia sinensis var. sinensis]